MKHIAAMIMLAWWLAGIALANGIVSTTAAIFFVPWGLYLAVHHALTAAGCLP